MLQETLDPLIIDHLENQVDAIGNVVLQQDLLHFQQDGAPSYYYLFVRQWFNDRYPDKWIG